MRSPCYECEERYVGCHTNCKNYTPNKDNYKPDPVTDYMVEKRIRIKRKVRDLWGR